MPDRGLKKLRSDDTEIEIIDELINQEISVQCRSMDNILLNAITEQTIAVKPEYIYKQTQKKHGEISKCNATMIVTTEKNLKETVKLLTETKYSDNIVLALFVEGNDVDKDLNTFWEEIKFKPEQKVVVKLAGRDTSSQPLLIDRKSTKLSNENQLRSVLSALSKSDSFSGWRESKERVESPPRSRTNSPRRRFSPSNSPTKTRQRCASQSSDTTHSLSTSPTRQRKQKSKKQKTDSQCSSEQNFLPVTAISTETNLATSSSLCASSSLDTSRAGSHICDVSPSNYQKSSNIEPMDVEISEECQTIANRFEKENDEETITSTLKAYPISSESMKKLDTEVLRRAVSFQLECHFVDIIDRIIKFLKAVRDRRDLSTNVEDFTTLDKLIYEIEGLLGQSITEKGKAMKEEIEDSRLSTHVAQDLLKVKGVYGCGTVYNKLNVHIEASNDKDKADVEDKIRQITERNNINETDYVVNVVTSRPSLFGRIVVCY